MRSSEPTVSAPGPGSAGSPAPGRAGRPRGARRCYRRGRADRGAVTAELAVGMLSLVGVTAVLLWGLAVATLQLRLVDAAAEGARAAARGETAAVVRTVAAGAAPAITGVEVRRSERAGVGVTRVTVTARPTTNLGGFRVALVTLRAEATARIEP